MLSINSLAIGAASLFAVAAANHGSDLHARAHHHDVAERSEHSLQKRFAGTATYYLTGLGACGIYNNPGDKIVALNSAQYGGGYPGPNCFKSITICAKGKCHGAQITDECPTCDYGSLDLSQGLFEQFANTDDGVFPMTWSFNDGNDEPPKPTTTKKPDPPKTTKQPEPTKEPEPEPTTTWEPPKTTSTKKRTTTSPPPETTSTPEPTTSTTSSTPEPTSTSEAKSSTSSTPAPTSTSVAPSVVAASSAPAATGSPAPVSGPGSGSNSGSSGGSNLEDANQIMLALGKMAVVANGGH